MSLNNNDLQKEFPRLLALQDLELGRTPGILHTDPGMIRPRDLTGYDAYLSGELTDFALPEEDLKQSLEGIKDLPKPPANKSGKW